MSPSEVLLAVGATVLGGLVRGFAGFGAAMVIVPLLSLIWAPQVAVATLMVLDLPALLVVGGTVLRQASWSAIWPLTAAAVPASVVGVHLLLSLDRATATRLIGGTVLVFVAVLATGFRLARTPARAWAALAGALSGLLNGATGVGGPPAVLWFLAGPGAHTEARANLMGYFFLLDLFAALAMVQAGTLTGPVALRALGLSATFLVGLWVGTRLFARATERQFRRLALVILTLAGLTALRA